MGRCIREAIEPFDVAGLSDASRHPWYPAKVSDLLRGAPKLGVSESEMVTMLKKCRTHGGNNDLRCMWKNLVNEDLRQTG